MLTKLETSDTSALAPTGRGDSTAMEEEVAKNNNEDDDWNHDENDDCDEMTDDDEEWSTITAIDGSRWGRTWQSFNFDFGTNNYLEDGKFPDSQQRAILRTSMGIVVCVDSHQFNEHDWVKNFSWNGELA